MKKIYLKPLAEFEEIEEVMLDPVSTESQNVAPELGDQTPGPSGGSEIGDDPEGGFDW